MDFNTVLANSVSLIKLGDIHKMKKYSKYGAGLLTKTYMYVTKNRTHEKRENSAKDKESESPGEAR